MKPESRSHSSHGNRVHQQVVAARPARTARHPTDGARDEQPKPRLRQRKGAGGQTSDQIAQAGYLMPQSFVIRDSAAADFRKGGSAIGGAFDDSKSGGRGADRRNKQRQNRGRHLMTEIREQTRQTHARDVAIKPSRKRSSFLGLL